MENNKSFLVFIAGKLGVMLGILLFIVFCTGFFLAMAGVNFWLSLFYFVLFALLIILDQYSKYKLRNRK